MNYETQTVYDWLLNDENLYSMLMDLIHDDVLDDYERKQDLRDYIIDMALDCVGDSGMLADLLLGALDDVDWYAILSSSAE